MYSLYFCLLYSSWRAWYLQFQNTKRLSFVVHASRRSELGWKSRWTIDVHIMVDIVFIPITQASTAGNVEPPPANST
jgi:hypothetical protein